jgi:hypothetical protein
VIYFDFHSSFRTVKGTDVPMPLFPYKRPKTLQSRFVRAGDNSKMEGV